MSVNSFFLNCANGTQLRKMSHIYELDNILQIFLLQLEGFMLRVNCPCRHFIHHAFLSDVIHTLL